MNSRYPEYAADMQPLHGADVEAPGADGDAVAALVLQQLLAAEIDGHVGLPLDELSSRLRPARYETP
jgi:hypothetical protein